MLVNKNLFTSSVLHTYGSARPLWRHPAGRVQNLTGTNALLLVASNQLKLRTSFPNRRKAYPVHSYGPNSLYYVWSSHLKIAGALALIAQPERLQTPRRFSCPLQWSDCGVLPISRVLSTPDGSRDQRRRRWRLASLAAQGRVRFEGRGGGPSRDGGPELLRV